ncbi:hypothetical protein HPP92_000181 [Vanilla planifolia]|uniref:Uncharacterized protein n=1 Tax=Vanilla planifolia TaxID=51239 RepID=A0A835VGS5_VANPL|nr:hypothetical protein HPP92_000181 [Vanilla planifolia]
MLLWISLFPRPFMLLVIYVLSTNMRASADFAFQPKNGKFISRSNTTVDPFERKENPQEISERILRLSQSLSNKVLVSRLPDQGEKIRKQISELEARKFRLLAF